MVNACEIVTFSMDFGAGAMKNPAEIAAFPAHAEQTLLKPHQRQFEDLLRVLNCSAAVFEEQLRLCNALEAE
jgi:hypothetical protein